MAPPMVAIGPPPIAAPAAAPVPAPIISARDAHPLIATTAATNAIPIPDFMSLPLKKVENHGRDWNIHPYYEGCQVVTVGNAFGKPTIPLRAPASRESRA